MRKLIDCALERYCQNFDVEKLTAVSAILSFRDSNILTELSDIQAIWLNLRQLDFDNLVRSTPTTVAKLGRATLQHQCVDLPVI